MRHSPDAHKCRGDANGVAASDQVPAHFCARDDDRDSRTCQPTSFGLCKRANGREGTGGRPSTRSACHRPSTRPKSRGLLLVRLPRRNPNDAALAAPNRCHRIRAIRHTASTPNGAHPQNRFVHSAPGNRHGAVPTDRQRSVARRNPVADRHGAARFALTAAAVGIGVSGVVVKRATSKRGIESRFPSRRQA
jgi:hypothetical protein